MSRLRDARVILIIILLISWVAGGLFFYNYKTTTDGVILGKDNEIASLNAALEEIGELVPAYTVASEVTSGQEVKDTDLQLIEVPRSMAGNLITDMEQLVGKYYKLKLQADTPLTNDLVYEEPVSDDMRLFDIVTHQNPIGLEEGSFVDIRIQMPMGEDYVAIPHRKVVGINSGILKVAVTEEDIHTYNSMLVDSILYPGTQIYAVEYLEGGIQKPAEAYYPVSTNVVAIAQKDPNLLSAIRSDILQRREILETGLGVAGVGLDEKEQEKLSDIISKARQDVLKSIDNSQKEVEKQRAEFEKQQQQQQNNN